MIGRTFHDASAVYTITGFKTAEIKEITAHCGHFKVPKTIFNENVIYNIIGVSNGANVHNRPARVISFDKSSLVESVSTYFILSSRSVFYLPPRIKRIVSNNYINSKWPIVKFSQKSKFITIDNEGSMMNNYPLELVHYGHHHSSLIIRERTLFVGSQACSYNKRIKSVSIPPSVELIDSFAFYECINLKTVIFKGRSQLKCIGVSAFRMTSVTRIDFPATVKEIGLSAFYECKNLSHISFPQDSRLESIESMSFLGTNIEKVEFPKSLVFVKFKAFAFCLRLSKFSFLGELKDKFIDDDIFNFSPCEVNFTEMLYRLRKELDEQKSKNIKVEKEEKLINPWLSTNIDNIWLNILSK